MAYGPKPRDMVERFWGMVDKTTTPDGCWEWTGTRHFFGYGIFGTRGTNKVTAHRIAWMLFRGDIPKGMYVCHHCDNPPCSRIDHLYLATQKQNMMDCATRGRTVYQRRPEICPWKLGRLPPPRIGELNGRTKLTEAKVLEMRQLARDGLSQRAIAAKYGVSFAQANHAINGYAWAHLPGAVQKPGCVYKRKPKP